VLNRTAFIVPSAPVLKKAPPVGPEWLHEVKALTALPPCIIDAELVGCDADGIPDFHALTTGNAHGCCAWCFDLMTVDGKDVRSEPLEERRARLEALLAGADQDLLRLSESFDEPVKLLEAAVKLGLEGIVSKRREQSFRSGPNSGWVKVKTAAWREANKDRWEMFQRGAAARRD
jgi:bifunctional non-homologous end joining protein LigD